MPGGYRSIVLAALGCLILAAAQAPQPKGKTEQAAGSSKIERAAAPVATSAAEPVKPVKSPQYERPCNQGEDNRESDLCAQWKAADAAADSAWWAMASFVLGIFGTAALLWSIKLTRDALGVATASTDQFIAVERARIEAQLGQGAASGGRVKFDLRLRNVGRSPAQIVAVSYGTLPVHLYREKLLSIESPCPITVMPGEMIEHSAIDIPRPQKPGTIIGGYVVYLSAFGRPHKSYFVASISEYDRSGLVISQFNYGSQDVRDSTWPANT